ncbi:MAG: 4-hydroxythreonine-4-phosphate dehydrogenase PdxA [Pseudomonadota bacterium]
MNARAPIAITPGDPAGIGPDIAVMLAQDVSAHPCVFVTDPQVLESRATQLGLPLKTEAYSCDEPVTAQAGVAYVVEIEAAIEPIAGEADARNGDYVIQTLNRATAGCLDGEFAALVTGPVNKAVINQTGRAFSGHTEYLAELTGGYPVMMLAARDFRVALATTHLPLKDVSSAITPALLGQVLDILNADLQSKFGIESPRILVCGLNPHAGEGGYLGREEIDVIEPALAQARSRGIDVVGPLPADTLFTPRHLDNADAVLAMFHDQGLPVLKFAGFGDAVNITLGLPIIRTSVDHGTAYDLAATGHADPGSLHAALEAAITMIQKRVA